MILSMDWLICKSAKRRILRKRRNQSQKPTRRLIKTIT